MKHCSNCESDNSLDSIYCKICGQSLDEKLTMKTLFRETIANYFSFDSSLKRSFVPLLFQPGKIAKDFTDGKRTKYIHPAKLYLFTSFIFFIVLGISTSIVETPETNFVVKEPIEFPTERAIDSTYHFTESNDSISETSINSFNISIDSLNFRYTTENVLLMKIHQNLKNKKVNIVLEIISRLPIALIISVPIFTLFLLVLLYKQSQKYSEHLVHSMYYFSFTFIVWSLYVFVNTFSSASLDILDYLPVVISLLLWFYLTKSIKLFYGLRWMKSLLISSVQSILYMLIIIPIISITLALIAIVYS